MKYTPEITKEIVESYQNGTTVDQIAEKFSVPPRSVIAKLSSLGVYQKKLYLNKRGEVPVKKETLLESIATKLGVTPEMVESLEKCNKSVLVLINNRL